METVNNQPVKILQVCAIDFSVDRLLKPLIKESMAQGYEVHNACADTGLFTQLREEGLHMINMPIERKISPFSNLKTIGAFVSLLKKEQYDIVHVHTPVAALLARVAAKLAGQKNVIYTAHGFYFHDDMSPKVYKVFYGIEKYAAKWMTDWLLLQSIEDYQLAINDRFSPKEKTIHLSNGVDIWSKFNRDMVTTPTLRKEVEIEENDVVFTFIGRLVKEKGVFELLQAFNKLRQEDPNVKLVLIGGLLDSERDQESFAELQTLLTSQGVIQLGFRNDTPELLSISDVFVLPSHREGLPRSIIEAMGMNLPIIASNIRGCREEVFPNRNGFLFEKENTEELYESMKMLSQDESMRHSYSIESRKIAEELFDEQKVLAKQLELFDTLTKEVGTYEKTV
ncbi:glycosyltransferase family 4 protein [Planococcus sp. ISL-109]|uniref:glycosyltransferase family 4 protein n=1 Tax=Planococcus sp. ISL-109 TaxID=2819166 RepID=UPI001BE7797D|nr:glycosyltransferase family 4 protein [Planococcus sp. ISL-109]MBT2581227.1 glycosyltransferase family 4 protein [Planococcus sp. ISL-109]